MPALIPSPIRRKPSLDCRAWIASLLLCAVPAASPAQNFVKVTSASNPIVSEPGVSASSYAGSAWIDYDNDGNPDLFIVQRGLFKGNGSGGFTKVLTGAPSNMGTAIGCSWGDYDNDGRPDLFVSGPAARGSMLFRNDAGVFQKVFTGDLGDSLGNSGWGCAWADYDNDRFLDLAITFPDGFMGALHHSNILLHNDGAGALLRASYPAVTSGLGSFTIPTWSDYDQDGDMDLFIGAGPISHTGLDFCFRNDLKETGLSGFTRLSGFGPFPVLRDGQVWNWVDMDNDRDMDLCITNYNGGGSSRRNELWRNDGAGVFTQLSAAQAGDIVTHVGSHLGSTWGDFDNDGLPDCYVSADAGSFSQFYHNNGACHFTYVNFGGLPIEGTIHFGAVAADYDNDGDLDLYTPGATTTKALLRNDLINGNHWAEFTLAGTASNRSAIGARIRIKATIGGSPTWMTREVSAQNTFNGHNELRVHFGLGNATIIDSVQVEWPSGYREGSGARGGDARYTLVEGVFGVTPVEVTLVDAISTDDGFPRITWRIDLAPRVVRIGRSTNGTSWQRVADLTPAPNGSLTYEDPDATPGVRYGYRVSYEGARGEIVRGEAWVQVPQARFALQGPVRNPVRGSVPVRFSLRDQSPATLELLDVNGRRIERIEVGGLGAGWHSVDVFTGRRVTSGLYFARLSAGHLALVKKITVMGD